MLFFELFPAFVMVVSLIVAIALFVANRGAPKDSSHVTEHPRTPAPARRGDPRTGTRPSMRG
jgi:hypothetical protein